MIETLYTKPVHYEPVEKRTFNAFREILFAPIVKIIYQVTRQAQRMLNSPQSDLRAALQTGKVQYVDGVFSGQFNSKVSSAIRELGAKFDTKKRIYKIDKEKVPNWVLSDSASYQDKAKATNQELESKLTEIQTNLDALVDKHPVIVDDVIGKISGDFKGIAKELEIPLTLSQDSIDKMSMDYTNNMKLWIKKWSEEEIAQLRGIVEDNAVEGYRFDRLIEKIQRRYAVTKSKAQFLARQETALFVSKFQQNRFKEAGVQSYVWSTSHDERVRESHKELDGKTFFWDNPPIIPGTSRRANVGEDFGCRCVGIPIIPGDQK